MPLRFPGMWRFTPPADGSFVNSSIPQEAIDDFLDLVDKLPAHDGRWQMYERFKMHFGVQSHSSSESWAHADLRRAMDARASNAPLFIENFFDGWEAFGSCTDSWFVPDPAFINQILAKHNIGYEIRPPDLVARETAGPTIAVPTPAPTMAERARDILDKSLRRSEELLSGGHPREAVQEVLWLLETVATAFKGIDTDFREDRR